MLFSLAKREFKPYLQKIRKFRKFKKTRNRCERFINFVKTRNRDREIQVNLGKFC